MLTRREFLGTTALAIGGLTAPGCLMAESKSPAVTPLRVSLNISTIRYYKLPVDQQIKVCGKAGFDGIELWTSDIEAYVNGGGNLTDLATMLKDNNLVLDNIIGFAQWAVDDQGRREAGFQQMKREMEMTAALGGKFIAAPMSGVNRLESSLDDYAQRFLPVIEAGKSLGVIPLLELWGAGALNKLEYAVYVALATGHPDANLLLDFYHLYRGGNPFESLNMINVERLPVFHINDYPADPPREQLNDRHRVYPGDGVCPFATVLPQMYKNGFRGALSVELFNDGYCRDNTVEQMLATTLEKTRKVISQSIS